MSEPTPGDRPDADATKSPAPSRTATPTPDPKNPDELPERMIEGRPKSAEAAEKALVRRKPQIGDSMPAPPGPPAAASPTAGDATGGDGGDAAPRKRRRRGGRGRGGGGGQGQGGQGGGRSASGQGGSGSGNARGNGGGRGQGTPAPGTAGRARAQGNTAKGGGGRGRGGEPVDAITADTPLELDDETLKKRRGRERKGRPVGRYLMSVSVRPSATQIAVQEGRALIEHYVSRPSDDTTQIHGNIYLGKVQNVLPGMEAAFIDIGTPKNAVLYRGDVQYDAEDIEEKGQARIEQILKPKQSIICQVTKNPIGAKGARLTQEVSLPGRFVVLIPNSTTYGISKRLADNERKRLRSILDRVRPAGHGIIVRTAAEGVSAEEIERDVARLGDQWTRIEALAKKSQAPALLYREPDMALRVIR